MGGPRWPAWSRWGCRGEWRYFHRRGDRRRGGERFNGGRWGWGRRGGRGGPGGAGGVGGGGNATGGSGGRPGSSGWANFPRGLGLYSYSTPGGWGGGGAFILVASRGTTFSGDAYRGNGQAAIYGDLTNTG